jgi:hypothetical protein
MIRIMAFLTDGAKVFYTDRRISRDMFLATYLIGARMYVIKQAGIGMATMSDLKTQAKQTLAATRDARI